MKLTATDLFAGCGGLSLGLSRAGFRVVSAVEIDSAAANTYRVNHPRTRLIHQDISDVSAEDLLPRRTKQGIHLVAGCAPCQGFCSLTNKNKKEDPRNRLVLEMSRIIEEVLPDAVLMENVPGLLHRGRPLLEEFVRRLRANGYYVQSRVVQMADYGVPQSRRRLVMLAGRGFAIPFPEQTHAKRPRPDLDWMPWVTVRQALPKNWGAPTRMHAARSAGPRRHNWHIVRDLQPQTKARLAAAVPGGSWQDLHERLRPNCHQGGYVGFTNVYGRMSWNQASPTITAGCTTPAKGRFGHPDRRRTTISVREAASLQTFPEEYDFATDHIEKVCELIGNAVPPKFAETIGTQILATLEAHYAAIGERV